METQLTLQRYTGYISSSMLTVLFSGRGFGIQHCKLSLQKSEKMANIWFLMCGFITGLSIWNLLVSKFSFLSTVALCATKRGGGQTLFLSLSPTKVDDTEQPE